MTDDGTRASTPRPAGKNGGWKSEQELLSLNRSLRALRKSSWAMTRAEDEPSFLAEACRIVVEDCGHAMAWIGYADENEGRTVRPVARAGCDQSYLDTLEITWADGERGRGPMGAAIRTGRPIACRNMQTDPDFAPWREEALRRGYASSFALPLIAEGKPFGAISIYSREPDPLSDDDVALLAQLADDVSFGIATIRLRVAHAKAEDTLRQSESRHRALFDNMLDGFAYCEMLFENGRPRDFRYLAVNAAFETLTGLNDVVGKRVSEVIPGVQEAHPELIETYGRVATTGQPERFEIHFRPLEEWFNISVYSNEKGYFTAVFDNVTVRRRAEETLRLHLTAIEAAANAIVITGRDGSIEWVNPAFTRLTGYGADEVIGWNPRILRSGRQSAAFYRTLWETILAGRVWQGEIINQRKDGSRYTEEMTITPVAEAGGSVTHFVAIKLDVTERRKAQDQLLELNETLEKRVAERTKEAEERADQLKTLATSLSQAERRERQRLATALHDHLQQILVAAKFNLDTLKGRIVGVDILSLARRVDELLDDSIAECRSLTVALSPTVLQEAGLAAALGWLARRMGEQHTLRVDLEVSEEWVEPADPDVKLLLFDATRELLFNVVKHAGVPEAKVALGRAEDCVEVRVEDRGRGLDPKVQLDHWDETTGVGLLFVQERLDLIGGGMTVEKAPGRGTRVTLRAPAGPVSEAAAGGPVAPEGAAARGAAGAVAAAARGGRIRILLADDHRIFRQALVALLVVEANLDVVGEAGDGAEAVELARTLQPDVILMDVTMPRLSGIEASRQIAADWPHMRIIGLSMHEDEAIADSMREAGAVDFLTKSGPPDLLIAAIRRAFPLDGMGKG